MKTEKQRKPVSMCTDCRTVAFELSYGHDECPEMRGSRKCRGVLKSTVNPSDWMECERCGAGGRTENEDCAYCNGVGWLFVRPGGIKGTQPPSGPMRGKLPH